MTKSALTRNQSLVLSALRAAKAPITAYGLLDGLRGEGFRAPPQVYRALDKLQHLGLVHRLESLNAFVACQHDHGGHGHHPTTAFAICTKCGNATELQENEIAHEVAALASASGFTLQGASIEVKGVCGTCKPLKGA